MIADIENLRILATCNISSVLLMEVGLKTRSCENDHEFGVGVSFHSFGPKVIKEFILRPTVLSFVFVSELCVKNFKIVFDHCTQ